MTPGDILIELQGITQQYGAGDRRFTAIESVSLTLREGEFLALLGPSGCGKSTLLRIITGLQTASAGRVLYRGAPLTGVNPHATIVFQTFALFPWLTVQENVEVALQVKGVPPEQRAARAVDALDRVGLDGFETAYPRELSGGMRQKVGFARAMVTEPEFLCLDEPFSALDVLSAESLRGELLELWTTGSIPTKAILMVSHSIDEAVLLADRIVVMDKNPGHIVHEIAIQLPHPRQRKSEPFQRMVDQVYALLAGQTQPEPVELGTAPGEPGETRRLPPVAISDLAALLETLAEEPNDRANIAWLEDQLEIELDQMLHLIEAAELLGFVTVAAGAITLTPLGETFAGARIQGRKEIFAARIRRLPVFRWLRSMLMAADKKQLNWEVIRTALELDFPPAEAEHQMDTLVDWGRYAEFLVYDDDSELVILEENQIGLTARKS